MKKHNPELGCCIPVDFDEWTDLGFIAPIYSRKRKKVIDCEMKVMVHKLVDSDGVKLWFSLEEIEK